MRTILIASMFSIVVTGCVMDAAEDESLDELSADLHEAEWAADALETSSEAATANGSATVASPEIAASGLSWRFFSPEYCIDLFGRSCSRVVPSGQCPARPQGKRCYQRGASCWYVVSATRVHQYYCQ